jgi:hypothetical protein
VAQQTYLKSGQCTLHNLKATAAEIINLTRIALVIGTLKLQQHWSRLLWLHLMCYHVPKNRYFKLRNNLHFVNNFGDRDPDDKLWKIIPLIDAIRKNCITGPHSSHLSIDNQTIPFAQMCGFRHFVPSKTNPLVVKNFVVAQIMVLH